MRLAALTTAMMLAATSAAPSQIDCPDAINMANSAGALVYALNEMTELCTGRTDSDETCRNYARILKDHAVPERTLALSTSFLLLSVKCPD